MLVFLAFLAPKSPYQDLTSAWDRIAHHEMAAVDTAWHSWAVARDQLGARAAAAVAADEAREKLDADLEMQRIM